VPFDNIKTIQQTIPEKMTMREIGSKLYREGGLNRLWRGSLPTFVRGYLGAMIVLPLFDSIHFKLANTKE